MRKKKTKSVLVQVIDGGPWFVDAELVDTSWQGHWFFPKVITKDGIYRENPPRPLTFESVRRLKPTQYLDAEDVANLVGCSRLNVHRHVWAGRLKPERFKRVGARQTDKSNADDDRKLLFQPDSVLKWSKEKIVKMGRPKKEKKQ
jgi:hypothetical protein